MRNFLLILGLLLFSYSLFGQVIEKVVAVAPVSYFGESSNKSDAVRLYNYLINDLHQSQRLKVIDRMNQHHITAEQGQQKKKESVLVQSLVKQGKLLGAQFIFLCQINNAKPVEIKNSKTNEITGYECDFSIFTRILNVESGEIVATALITPKGIQDRSKSKAVDIDLASFAKKSETPGEAVRKSMEKVEPHLHEFIDKNFPLEMRINDIKEVVHSTSKKDKSVTEVFIKGGISTGLKMKDNLEIKEIIEREIDGELSIDEVPIGKLKVIRINEDLVVCKIIDEVKTVKEVFENDQKENKNTLKVVYITKNFPF